MGAFEQKTRPELLVSELKCREFETEACHTSSKKLATGDPRMLADVHHLKHIRYLILKCADIGDANDAEDITNSAMATTTGTETDLNDEDDALDHDERVGSSLDQTTGFSSSETPLPFISMNYIAVTTAVSPMTLLIHQDPSPSSSTAEDSAPRVNAPPLAYTARLLVVRCILQRGDEDGRFVEIMKVVIMEDQQRHEAERQRREDERKNKECRHHVLMKMSHDVN